MSSRSRYLIIVLGVICFVILAPLVVLYATGIKYDWKSNRLAKTGILAFKTEPKNVRIFLDDTELDNPGETLRFLQPKDYLLKFASPGYCTWQKRLPVNATEVTWANPQDSKIFLLKDKAATKILSQEKFIDFLFTNNTIYGLTKQAVVVLNIDGKVLQKFDLEFLPTGFESAGENKFLIFGQQNLVLLDAATKKLTDLSGLFQNKPKIVSSQSSIFALANGNLYSLDEQKKLTEIDSDMLDFTALSGDIYAINASSTSTVLKTFPLSDPSESMILATLPKFNLAKIFVTEQKQIFVLGDGMLYQVSIDPKNLGSTSEVTFSPDKPVLMYFSQGEVNYFDFRDFQPKLITRSGQNLKNLTLQSTIGYALWQKSQDVEALELDRRDAQNSCTLYQGTDIKKIAVDDNGSTLLVLDADTLKAVKFR